MLLCCMLQITKPVVFKASRTAKNLNAGIILYTLARFNCDSISSRYLHLYSLVFHVESFCIILDL